MVLAVVAGLAPSLGRSADDQAATAPPPPVAADPAKEILGYYPPSALAANTAGVATLTCGQDTHLALINCSLVSESPVGQGFGAAALSIASRSVGGPWIALDRPPTAPRTVRITFTPQPTTITPNLLAPMPWRPIWTALPTASEVGDAYPARAQSLHISGHVILKCSITSTGGLTACTTFDEAPPGEGFAQAGLSLARYFKVAPPQGPSPPDGFTATVPIRFQDH